MSTVLVLGATSDIGTAIAREFAQKKFNVQLAARDSSKLTPLQTDLSIRFNIRCTVYQFDAIDFASHLLFYQTLNPKPDIVVCVFGYMKDNESTVNSDNETLRTIHTNYTGAVSILNIVAADFASQKKGTIVGISSVAGERGRQSNYIYGSAKAGFTAYLSGLRNKLYEKGVHVVTVLPGFVYTKMTEHLNLPKLLTAHPNDVARSIYNAVQKKRNIIYVKWFWRWIMCIIRLIPEPVFKRKKL
ncbi:SDR family oxidoreductase [Agriterribacter sp.]|uniref:SDR family oxidoreductase n=1 Tax=Agriterribacter sp. TaxID=2821509 RepID=UPI002C81506C|nr:SDR family oxidoreductase [Agriterribacter sp.]HRO47885.1 SDR family oxidoreductase [Agriterribacter sp.]HRQ18819.1 SDR family oxidoreductase [Agriterribacter sp.]